MKKWTTEELRARRRRIEQGNPDFLDRACDKELLWIIGLISAMIAGIGAWCLR